MNARHHVSRRPRRIDRQMTLELLRLQAHYERLDLQQQLSGLTAQLSTDALARRARSGLEGAGLRWLGQGLGLVRRYPRLLSLLLTLVPPGRRSRSIAGLGLAALMIWRGAQRRDPG